MNLDELKTRLQKLGPVSLGYLPTPISPLPRLSEALGGPEIWVKRDDLTGLATGGNKVRKLNYVMADAVQQKADLVMTTGAQQSNQARQAAAAAAMLGIPCTLVLGGPPPQGAPQGNYLIDRLVGAEAIWAYDTPTDLALEEAAERIRAEGKNPYVIPLGASNGLGTCGYVEAMVEALEQSRELDQGFDVMVVASGSGGTQAGMALGARALGYKGQVIGVSIIEYTATYRPKVAQLAQDAAQLLELDLQLTEDELVVDDGYLEAGYGVLTEGEREAIQLAARYEGLLIDPVYTGRALAGLIAMIRAGKFSKSERVLFWHTGGTPALFHYAEKLL
jgi:D-cysteine desulfhydrase family pyridoxal phosphate-dependent enzyme